MKSAYELAMERLNREAPETRRKPLTDQQKAELAQIEERYRAKKAEREIFLKQQLSGAARERDREAMLQIERQLQDEMARIEEEKEAAKDRVRNS